MMRIMAYLYHKFYLEHPLEYMILVVLNLTLMPLEGHPEIRVNKPQSAQRTAESTETLEKPLCPLFFLCVLCGLKTMQI